MVRFKLDSCHRRTFSVSGGSNSRSIRNTVDDQGSPVRGTVPLTAGTAGTRETSTGVPITAGTAVGTAVGTAAILARSRTRVWDPGELERMAPVVWR